MGSVTTAKGDCALEVGGRIRAHGAAFGPLHKKVFGNQAFGVPTRAGLARSLLDTRLFFNAHTWIGVTPPNTKSMKSQSANAFRVICGTQKGDCRSTHDRTDFQIFSTVNAPHTETTL
eukprot:9676229-Alexandrium_andersonii.AAC.1